MSYQVNNYRNDWHSKNYECCDNCSTSNNNTCNNQITPEHAAATQLTMFFTSLVSGGIEYYGNKVQVADKDVEEESGEFAQEPKIETSIEKENNVKNLLGTDKFNNLSAEDKTDVLKKYDTIKAYAQQNNIEITDAELSRRLNSYIKALAAKEKEVEMTKHIEAGGTIEEFKGSIVDEDIKQQKATGTDEQYFQAILNRGTGSVQLFDENGDNQVTEKEYLQGQAKEYKNLYGEDISSEMEEATKKMFNKLNRDKTTDSAGNQFLSEAEFATHEFAIATLGDTDKNTNEELTIRESLLSSMILDEPGIEEKYDYASNQIWDALKTLK